MSLHHISLHLKRSFSDRIQDPSLLIDLVDIRIAMMPDLSSSLPPPPRSWLLLVLFLYPVLTNLLRYRRLRSLKKRFHYPTRTTFSRMTDDDAWAIKSDISELEFPSTFRLGIQFALFRVCSLSW